MLRSSHCGAGREACCKVKAQWACTLPELRPRSGCELFHNYFRLPKEWGPTVDPLFECGVKCGVHDRGCVDLRVEADTAFGIADEGRANASSAGFQAPKSALPWRLIIPADDGQGFQSDVDTDSSGTWTEFWRDRGQNPKGAGIAVTMPWWHGRQDDANGKTLGQGQGA